MTLTSPQPVVPRRRLLFACGRIVGEGPRWYGALDEVFRPAGLELCRTHNRFQAIERIEYGGLAGAVLVGRAAVPMPP